MLLCQWAITPHRHGIHRPLLAARLLSQLQSYVLQNRHASHYQDLDSLDERWEQQTSSPSFPNDPSAFPFQNIFFQFLDTRGPVPCELGVWSGVEWVWFDGLSLRCGDDFGRKYTCTLVNGCGCFNWCLWLVGVSPYVMIECSYPLCDISSVPYSPSLLPSSPPSLPPSLSPQALSIVLSKQVNPSSSQWFYMQS